MAASRIDSEVGEHQLTSATAAVLSRSSSEARIAKSWTDYNHRAKYIKESLSRSKFYDHPSKQSNNGNSVTENYYIQDNEEWSDQEEKSISENKIYVANRLDINEDINRDKMNNDISNTINDHKLITCKKNNEKFNDSRDKLEVKCTNSLNNEIKRTQQIFNKGNQTIFNNEYNERQMCTVREIKIATASTNNCIKNPSESAYYSDDVDKTIESNKCKHARDIESRKNDGDEDGMEISSPRSRVYPHGDNVIVSAATSSTSAFQEHPRGEASRKVVHSSAKDRSTPGKPQRSASVRNAIDDRGESRNRETDIDIICTEDKKNSNARKCENCGKSHLSYDRYSRLWKYSEYRNREKANQDASKIAVNQSDSTKLMSPIATVALRRSRSLPRLSIHDSGVACSDHAPAAPEQTHAAPRQLVADLRQLLTLKQHYYPEGGWGWVILLVGLLVQILSHGAHGAVGVFLQQAEVRFGPHVHLQAG
ncbi:hypothetical protein ALC60_04914 [Trachymyrmex zeteki]|uniref:Uncharacterized protein n=1 Tax=Mycetomoellerius zeteki TaxID=64791 RepID=A0A151X729_9HYME|nr:hypothetical protein ALC60_04914 [Trachymyrmex zeteki]